MNTKIDLEHIHCDSRRALLKSTMGLATLGAIGASLIGVTELSDAAALTKDARDKLTPDQIIEEMKQGGRRVADGGDRAIEPVAPKFERGSAARGAEFLRERCDGWVVKLADHLVAAR